jgi:hypothetical protein
MTSAMQDLAQEKRTPLCGSATRTASPMPWPILANRKRSAHERFAALPRHPYEAAA